MHEREFSFTAADFERIRALLYEHTGISLNAGKMDMVYSRIARRLRALGLPSVAVYLQQLVAEGQQGEEWQQFINALTTNLTAFFRESYHFPLLAQHVLAQERSGRQPLRLWSAACSTGEEAYSMAMTLIDAFGTWRPPARILATDVDTNVVRQAALGIYPLERGAQLPEGYLQRFFQRGKDRQAGRMRVRAEVRDLIEFRVLNLLGGHWSIRGPLDVIFCRNVLIYFDKPTQYRLLARFHPLLHREGLLFVGHSESLTQAADLFRLRGKTVYQPVIRT